MNGRKDPVICHWLTPTRIMPHPYSFEADEKPWTCLRDGAPRALTCGEVERCANCPRWETRTLSHLQRDLAFETWDARCDMAWETFGVIVDGRR